MSNHLSNQTSPYLLQHKENPVDWYPWGEEAFRKARQEDKPIFLSIGYSTCHWCHVMARESFEDEEIACILNRSFVSIKVDKEERPDIDAIYMAVCQAFTGSGGWPTSIFMTADQKPFFAGTYFPKTARYGSIGLRELLLTIEKKWKTDRESLLHSAEEITALFGENQPSSPPDQDGGALLEKAMEWYRRNFDAPRGGFGTAPKFPAPHNLLFLLQQAEKHRDREALEMALTTLRQMYAGGLFDHIGYGFCRYSTDARYLVPHFEKMLYDNALLILAFCKAHELTGRPLYLKIAEKTASYILSQMTSPEGGFYSAQDADSQGEEGKYYLFTPEEILQLLGPEAGGAFCRRFDIGKTGHFQGKSIPNLLVSGDLEQDDFDRFLPVLREYRQKRCPLHTDDKILTSWNSLMIGALCQLYRRSRNPVYLDKAKKAQECIQRHLCRGNTLVVSFRQGKQGAPGFLEEYANFIFALLSLYDATLDRSYLRRAAQLCTKVSEDYFDWEHGGFYLTGKENEALLFRPKECYDGAMPSGNTTMAWNLLRLSTLEPQAVSPSLLEKQMDFLAGKAKRHPWNFAQFLMALSDFLEPPLHVTIVSSGENLRTLPFLLPSPALVTLPDSPSAPAPLLSGQTTCSVCRDGACLPPMSLEQFTESLKRPPLFSQEGSPRP